MHVECPTCPADSRRLTSTNSTEEVTAGLQGLDVPLRIAVMRCVVNGPARPAKSTSASRPGTAKDNDNTIRVRNEEPGNRDIPLHPVFLLAAAGLLILNSVTFGWILGLTGWITVAVLLSMWLGYTRSRHRRDLLGTQASSG
jgi:hypothetical protein